LAALGPTVVVPLALATCEEFLLEGTGKTKRKRKAKEPLPKPIAPYSSDIAAAARLCFDRETGKPIDAELLRAYRTVLAQYHLSPESKFLNAKPFDAGPTQRRHVVVAAVHHIEKEANKWEEQHYLGFDEGEQIEYGMAPGGLVQILELLRTTASNIGQRRLAAHLQISRRTLAKMLRGEDTRLLRLHSAQIVRAIEQLKTVTPQRRKR